MNGVPPQGEPWRGWWLPILALCLAVPIDGWILFLVAFGGRNYWAGYVLALGAWCGLFSTFCWSPGTAGVATRRVGIGLAGLGVLLWLAGWPSLLSDTGWQF